jgi:hypothetical protein
VLTPTAVTESRLKSVQEGSEQAAEPQGAAAADDGQQQAAAAQDFPEAAQRAASRQLSRKSLDWKRQESLLIGSVSVMCFPAVDRGAEWPQEERPTPRTAGASHCSSVGQVCQAMQLQVEFWRCELGNEQAARAPASSPHPSATCCRNAAGGAHQMQRTTAAGL